MINQPAPFGGSPFSTPFSPPAHNSFRPTVRASSSLATPSEKPAEGLPRQIQYAADYSGCGKWRLLWPELILNGHQKAISSSTSVMILQPEYYAGCKVIKVQRQATPAQLQFIKYLKNEVCPKHGTRIVYEIDDVVFREDIPDYNKFKFAFESDEIRESTLEIIKLCDEMTVTNEFMRDYYREKTGKREITIIPNFTPKFWMGNFFNQRRVNHLFNKYRKRPRILYAGSGAHFDVDNKTKQRDDFEHVIEAIIKTRKKYQWVFLGAFPPPLTPYVQNGDIEFHNWQRMYEYPQKIYDLEVQMSVAPLQDNIFNRSKSDLKMIEAGCYGIPIACQDMCTYKDAPVKFKTGDEMIECIDRELSSASVYKEKAPGRYRQAQKRFLENDENIDCYVELLNLPYGDKDRKMLSKWNNNI